MRPTFLLRRTTLVPSRPSSSHTPRHRSRRYESHSTKPDSAPIKPDGASKPEPPTSPSAQQPSHSHAQSTSSPTPTPAGAPAASAASTAPSVPARSVPQSLSLRERISAGPLGKFGRSYSRYQEQRPYTTQLVSSLVIYLCGDLSAQYFFPAEKRGVQQDGPGKEDKDGEVETEEEEGGGGYDPYRTLRHLTVGIGSSIPSYNWYLLSLSPPTHPIQTSKH
ncbi:hypothetical protein BJY04DRAFT_200155 [Aspergillus karnatakaensis]|uniref:uncharacterized protein n=1 Tax=Aspergillus karnatakaensis TaxID=1810916 RepID=UPI003CCCBCF8